MLGLSNIQVGQEILYDDFQKVKKGIQDDFINLKSQKVLGKDTSFKVALGTIGKYAGNKIADVIFDQLKPYLTAFFIAEASIILDFLSKLIGN